METENFALTENGDKAFSTSGNFNLDFFTRITRNAQLKDYVDAFQKAWIENRETAIRVVMNMRDIRGGKGEKLIPAVLMICLKLTAEPNVYEAVLRKMVEYGCWKDLLRIIELETRYHREQRNLQLIACPIEITLFAEQLKKDSNIILVAEQGDTNTKAAISLCAKWAPSENTHYDHHPMKAATKIMGVMNLKPKEYRQMLTKLRNHLGILEMLMSTRQYDKIDFSKLPSMAFIKMKRAFDRDNNADGVESDNRKKLHLSYQEYLRKLADGKTKVNIKGIQPHELVSTYLDRHSNTELDPLVEGQWQALKNRITETGSFRDVTAVVDVSGSMTGQPMQVSIALGILVAQCTKCPYHGKVITFHETPNWHVLTGTTLKEQVECMKAAPWGSTTNLRKVFDLILQQAKSASLTKEEMVKTLFIFTDMQFDTCAGRDPLETTFEYAKREFSNAGYVLPRIVCWNLRTSTNKIMPIQGEEKDFAMLSGFSAELLKCILTAQEFTPNAMMQHVLEPYIVPHEVTTSTNDIIFTTDELDKLEIAITKSTIKKAFKSSASTDESDVVGL